MNRKLLLSAAVPACIALQLAVLPIPAFAQGSSGSVGGVTRNSVSKQPVAHVQIVAHNLTKGTDHNAVSGLDGTFAMARLEPGAYQVAAIRDGFITSTASVEVSALGTYRIDFLLAEGHPAMPAAKTPSGDPSMAEVTEELAAMKERIVQLEAALRARTSSAAPPAEAVTASAAPALDAAQDSSQVRGKAATPITAPPVAPAIPVLPEALQAPETVAGVDNVTPFAYGDFTWLNGTPRNKDTVLDTKFFTPEVRFDTHFIEDFNQPKDHSMGGATESFRSGEFQVEQISVGGDFHWQNVRGRLLTMNGLFATTTPRNDASAGVGQWDVRDAYKYVSEAYGGYHFNVNHGLNVDAGIFVSYIGLFSYYNFDNWTYQPSFVSSNTPWFFNGMRIQWFPTNKLKIEPWIINGWQSYNKFNGHMGLGGQILYRPHEWLSLVFNNYGDGTDTLGVPGRSRLHTDDSIEVRYFNNPTATGIDKMAFSLTGDLGCEYGGGVTCHGGKAGPKQAFLGWMLYDRVWWGRDKYGITIGGGQMNNPGRYLTLLPPINGADAISGSPYFPESPGLKAHMWDTTLNLQYMPKQYITWWIETGYRHSDIPYWTGRQGITPPGGNTGSPGQFVCTNGSTSVASPDGSCAAGTTLWNPDLRHGQAALSSGVMVKF